MNKKKNIFTGSDCPSPEVLHSYLMNNLSKEEKHMVEEHLIDCMMCSDELEGLASMKDPEILSEYAEEIQQDLGISEVRKIRFRPVYQLAVAVAILFIVAGTIFLTEYLSDNGTSEMVSQQMEEPDKEKASPAIGRSQEKAAEETAVEEVVSSDQESGKGMKKSDEVVEMKADIPEKDIAQEEEVIIEEEAEVSDRIILEVAAEEDAMGMQAEGAGINDEVDGAVIMGKDEKKDMVMQELTGQKSRSASKKSGKSKGQDFTISTTPAVDSAAIYYNLKQHEKAINYLKDILKNNKGNEKALYEMALNYFATDDYKRSMKYISRLTELESSEYSDECEALLHSIIEKSSKYRAMAEKLLDSIR